MRISLRKKKDHIITLHYQVFFDPSSRQSECFVSSVEPERLGQRWNEIKDQYNIVHHPASKDITLVENRAFGKVFFKVIKAEGSAGHVQGSKAEIWTAVPQIGVPMLNILHFHINDMSDEVSIDQRWVTTQERDHIMNGNID